ncbi:uncharacterized protein LOC144440105 [Glandiceps talaboti]
MIYVLVLTCLWIAVGTTDGICGASGRFYQRTVNSGQITTLTYPENNTSGCDGEKCRWFIHVVGGNQLQFTFSKSDFEVKFPNELKIYKGRRCETDYGEISKISDLPPLVPVPVLSNCACVVLRYSYGGESNFTIKVKGLPDFKTKEITATTSVEVTTYRDLTKTTQFVTTSSQSIVTSRALPTSMETTPITSKEPSLTSKPTMLSTVSPSPRTVISSSPVATQSTTDLSAGIDECAIGLDKCSFSIRHEQCIDTTESYNCTCTDGYHKKSDVCVPTPIERSKYCRDNGASVPTCPAIKSDKHLLVWNYTKANCRTDWELCERYRVDTIGYMKRECGSDGKWMLADTSNCVTESIREISKEIEKVTDVETALKVLSSLQRLTNHGPVHVDGDLTAAADIIRGLLNKKPLELTGKPEGKMNVIKGIFQASGGFLGSNQGDAWKNICKNNGPTKGVWSHLVNIRRFSIDLYDFAINQDKNLDPIKTENMDFELSIINSNESAVTDKSRSVRSVGNTMCNGQSKTSCVSVQPPWNDTDKAVGIAITNYKTLGDILPQTADNQRSTIPSFDYTTKESLLRVHPEVIEVSVLPDRVASIGYPVTITFYHGQKDVINQSCVHLTYDNGNGIWGTFGCWMVESQKGGYTVCRCNNHTNFGLIMELKSAVKTASAVMLQLSTDMSVLGMLGVAIILFLLSIIILMLTRIPGDHQFVLINTVIAIFIQTVCILIALQIKEEMWYCLLVTVSVNIILLNSCSWLMMMALHLFLRVKLFIYKSVKARILYVIIGWVMPVVYGLFCVAGLHDYYRSAKLCWVITGSQSLIIILPTMIVFTVTLGLLIATYWILSGYTRRVQMEEFIRTWFDIRVVFTTFAMYTISWMLGMWSASESSSVANYILAILLMILALFMLITCVHNKEVSSSLRIVLHSMCGCQCTKVSSNFKEVSKKRKGILKHAKDEMKRQRILQKNGQKSRNGKCLTPSQKEIGRHLVQGNSLQWKAYMEPHGTVWVVKHKAMEGGLSDESRESIV